VSAWVSIVPSRRMCENRRATFDEPPTNKKKAMTFEGLLLRATKLPAATEMRFARSGRGPPQRSCFAPCVRNQWGSPDLGRPPSFSSKIDVGDPGSVEAGLKGGAIEMGKINVKRAMIERLRPF